MRRAMLRDLAAHRGRVAMTLAAIALGVAMVVAGWTVGDSVAVTLAGQEGRTLAGVVVWGADGAQDLTPAERDRLAALPGVDGALGVSAGRAGLVGRDGKLVRTETAPDLAGTGWDGSGRFSLTEGRAPARRGEVALRRAEAGRAGLRVGETARVLLGDGASDRFLVVGLFGYRPLGPLSGTDQERVPVVAFERATAERLLGDRFRRIELTAATGADLDAIGRAALRAVGQEGRHVSTGPRLAARAAERADEDVWELRLTLLPFAAVALLVGVFVIANTFTMLVTQRIRQYALLRAVGALRRQIRGTVLVEAVALGLAGGTLGAVVGAALGPLMIAIMRPGDEMTYAGAPVGILIGYAVAVPVTVLAAYGAARRAAAVPPVAALRADATTPRRDRAGRSLPGLAALVAAAVAVALTADPSSGTLPRIVALVAAAIGCAGVLSLAPVLVEALSRPLIWLAWRYGGPATRLGVRDAARDPRRTAGTASAIAVGLGLVCAFATVSSTFATLIASTTRANVPVSTTVLKPAAGDDSTLPAADVERVRALRGVTVVAASRDMIADIGHAGGTTRWKISAIEPAALGTVLTPKITAGSADLTRGVVIARNQADMLGVGLGSPLTVNPGSGKPIVTRVAGVYEATELSSSIFFDVALAPEPLRRRITMIYATGSAPATVRRSVEAAFRDRPDVTVTDRDGLVEEGVDRQRLAFVAMYAMFGLAGLIAVFGVVNTLALSVMERTREIGMLRAVGASRLLVGRSIRVESLVISVFGGVLGIAVGVPAGAVMQHAMLGQRLWDATVPTGVIALTLVGIALAGMAAAMWPARRAVRIDVLTAVTGP
ncbi:ABC transporter permease [Streptosporangium sp. NPDC051023]|uniref:ABC transporter permease n=1 Tax=Streptosporangium sp. NPDC051023 TaxID=3155410 RepID=UPI00344FC5B6